ncbi:MAG: hypothetical protein M1821_005945 [Bathelium mastoideum]|nr:MAG: hypothetical protein M1821_005945 [Bathelium mastoideum]
MSFLLKSLRKRDFPGPGPEEAVPLQDSETSETWFSVDEEASQTHHDRDVDSLDGFEGDDNGAEHSKLQPAEDAAITSGESIYDQRSKIINQAIQDIGMGKYQWRLFVLCGFGWLADNIWMQGVALTLPQLSVEFGVDSNTIRYTTMATYIGLSFGASFWGVASDVIGRRLAFNCTLMLAGVFGFLSGFAPNWATTNLLYALMGFGVGGNLPVDGALFLEFLPASSGNLLTLLSVWWPLGQLLSSLVGWALIPRYSCAADLKSCLATGGQEPCCSRANNMGWRYTIMTLGAITFAMFVCRFFLFKLYESPKYLVARGRLRDAVEVVRGIAAYNGTETSLSEERLLNIKGHQKGSGAATLERPGFLDAAKRNLGKFSTQRLTPLFSNWKLGITVSLIWFIWSAIGLGFPLFNAFLPQYLSNADAGPEQGPTSTDVAYRDVLITSIVGLPGSILACYTVDMKYLGRKGTMAVSTLVSGILLYLFTLSSNSSFQTAMSSLESFTQNIMYGVLYAYTPEVLPAPFRGTGTGVASFLNRIAGVLAPVLAVQIGKVHVSAPILVAAALFIVSSIAMAALPIESRGKASL